MTPLSWLYIHAQASPNDLQTFFATRQEAIKQSVRSKGGPARRKPSPLAEGDWELLVRFRCETPQKASESEETAPSVHGSRTYHEREGVLLWMKGVPEFAYRTPLVNDERFVHRNFAWLRGA